MLKSKGELLNKGWKVIGEVYGLEYLARENEHGEILYIPVRDEHAIVFAQSISKGLIRLLYDFISSNNDLEKN